MVRSVDGQWVSVRLMNEPLKALEQSYLRTKARTLDEYTKVMALHTNSSNNTLYADADGNRLISASWTVLWNATSAWAVSTAKPAYHAPRSGVLKRFPSGCP